MTAHGNFTTVRYEEDNVRLGDELRGARATISKSVSDVAADLRIRQAYIEAIEDGRLADLPSVTIAKGFVRSYAKYLDLDETVVLERFFAQEREALVAEGEKEGVPEESAVPASENPLDKLKAQKVRREFSFPVIAALALAALAALAYLGVSYLLPAVQQTRALPEITQEPAPAGAAPSAGAGIQRTVFSTPNQPTMDDYESGVERYWGTAPPAESRERPILEGVDIEAASQGTSPEAEAKQDSFIQKVSLILPEPVVEIDNSVLAGSAVRTEEGEITETAALNLDAGAEAEPGASELAPAPTAEVQIALLAVERSWVQVSDLDGNVIFSGELSKDESYDLPDDTIRLRVGNAGGISFLLNGEQTEVLGRSGQVLSNITVDAASLRERFSLTQ